MHRLQDMTSFHRSHGKRPVLLFPFRIKYWDVTGWKQTDTSLGSKDTKSLFRERQLNVVNWEEAEEKQNKQKATTSETNSREHFSLPLNPGCSAKDVMDAEFLGLYGPQWLILLASRFFERKHFIPSCQNQNQIQQTNLSVLDIVTNTSWEASEGRKDLSGLPGWEDNSITAVASQLCAHRTRCPPSHL